MSWKIHLRPTVSLQIKSNSPILPGNCVRSTLLVIAKIDLPLAKLALMDHLKPEIPKKSIFDRPGIYREQLLTLDDLADFKRQFLFEIKSMLKEYVGQPNKKWLKSHEVRKILNISAGTLHTLRNNGTLPSTKIGNIVFYDIEEIQQVLESKKKTPIRNN
jgi:predicted DNA-binding transcriptional regulator AlpA